MCYVVLVGAGFVNKNVLRAARLAERDGKPAASNQEMPVSSQPSSRVEEQPDSPPPYSEQTPSNRYEVR